MAFETSGTGRNGGYRLLEPRLLNTKMDEVILDTVSSVIAECLQTSNSEDVAELDVLSFNLRSCSIALGDVINEVISRSRHTCADQDQLSKLLDLLQYMTELSNFYESRLLKFTQRLTGTVMGRPRKMINIACTRRIKSMLKGAEGNSGMFNGNIPAV